MTLKDMEFLGLRNLATEKVTTVMGVPKVLLGNHNVGDFATTKFLVREFHQNVVIPVQQLIAGQITEKLIHSINDELKFEFNKPDSSDPDDLRRDMMTGKDKGILTANEVGEDAFSKEKIAGQDDLSKPVQVVPGKKPAAHGEQDQDAATEADAAPKKKSITNALTNDERDQIAAERETELEALTQDAIPGINSFFNEQSGRYQERLADYVKVEGGLDAFLAAATRAEEALLGALFTTLLYPSLFSGAQAAQLQINMTLSFDQINPFVAEYIKIEVLVHVQGINATTRDALRVELQAGMKAGESVDQLTERVKATFTDASTNRAKVIGVLRQPKPIPMPISRLQAPRA